MSVTTKYIQRRDVVSGITTMGGNQNQFYTVPIRVVGRTEMSIYLGGSLIAPTFVRDPATPLPISTQVRVQINRSDDTLFTNIYCNHVDTVEGSSPVTFWDHTFTIKIPGASKITLQLVNNNLEVVTTDVEGNALVGSDLLDALSPQSARLYMPNNLTKDLVEVTGGNVRDFKWLSFEDHIKTSGAHK